MKRARRGSRAERKGRRKRKKKRKRNERGCASEKLAQVKRYHGNWDASEVNDGCGVDVGERREKKRTSKLALERRKLLFAKNNNGKIVKDRGA